MLFRILYFAEWAARLVMLLVVIRQHRHATALAWLAVIFLHPWVGLPLYILFGSNRVSKRREQVLRRIENHLFRICNRIPTEAAPAGDRLNLDDSEIAGMVTSLGSFEPRGGGRIAFLATADFLENLFADIAGARRSVSLLYYVVGDDIVGERLERELVAAAARGVKCRILADAVGSRRFLRRHRRSLEAGGVLVGAALPWRFLRRIRRRLDVRNHRKIAVIDGRCGYIGSGNLCESHYGHRDLQWCDVTARVEGPITAHLQALFVSDWQAESMELPALDELFPPPERGGGSWLQLMPSGPIYNRRNYQQLVASALHRARKRVIITTPYFIPDETTLQALESACRKGVEVILALPAKTDQLLPGLAARSLYEEILEFGVSLFLFDEGMLHAKTVTVDNRMAFLGSGNLDMRSFSLNFEATLICYTTRDVDHLAQVQLDYISRCRRLTREEWAERTSFAKFIENMVRLLGPLL